MTATLEGIAIRTMVWGDAEQVLDAIDAGALVPDHFADPCHHRTAQAVLGLVCAGQVPTYGAVIGELLAQGLNGEAVANAVVPDGSLDAADYRLDGLAHWLHRVTEDHLRRLTMQRLLGLANTLERPGGPAQVAEVLGVIAA
jgi:hypothetical protein